MSIYRPPGYHYIDVFNDFIVDNLLSKISATSDIIISGDFNINLYNPRKLNPIDRFVYAMAGFNFFPIVNKPTRIDVNNPITKFSLLDHLWVNRCSGDVRLTTVIDCAITDHLPGCYFFKVDSNEQNNRKMVHRIFNENNIATFQREVLNKSFNEVINTECPNMALSKLTDTLTSTYNETIPLKSKILKDSKYNSPWITKEIKLLIRKKYRLLREFRLGYKTRRSINSYRNMLKLN